MIVMCYLTVMLLFVAVGARTHDLAALTHRRRIAAEAIWRGNRGHTAERVASGGERENRMPPNVPYAWEVDGACCGVSCQM